MFMYPHQLIGFTCKFVGSTRFVSGIKGPLSRTNKGLDLISDQMQVPVFLLLRVFLLYACLNVSNSSIFV